MKIDPLFHARGLTGETFRPPQRLQVQARRRVRRGLLLLVSLFPWFSRPAGAASPPAPLPRWKTLRGGGGEGAEAPAAEEASTTE